MHMYTQPLFFSMLLSVTSKTDLKLTSGCNVKFEIDCVKINFLCSGKPISQRLLIQQRNKLDIFQSFFVVRIKVLR